MDTHYLASLPWQEGVQGFHVEVNSGGKAQRQMSRNGNLFNIYCIANNSTKQVPS